jgi:hypothetical protein
LYADGINLLCKQNGTNETNSKETGLEIISGRTAYWTTSYLLQRKKGQEKRKYCNKEREGKKDSKIQVQNTTMTIMLVGI